MSKNSKDIVAFVGETFEFFDKKFYAKPTSAAFLQDAIGEAKIYVCSPTLKVDSIPKNFSTQVNESRFHPFPRYISTKDFVTKSLLQPGFFKRYAKAADEVIEKHKGSNFWIRTPSIGSIVFGLRALKAGEKVLHHMCADASNTWRDAKYSGIEKALGYLLSRYIRFKLKQICQHKNTLNLCTGNVLEEFSRRYAPESTIQFVDVMVTPPKEIIERQFDPKCVNILLVGRIVEDKGIFDLLKAVSALQPNCRATIVGDGPDLEKAQEISRKLGIDDVVEFTGQLPHKQLSEIYDKSDLVVVPSNNHYEGFPRVIMEAWSHHIPVVVANVGGIKAFVKNSQNGLIFEPGNTEQFTQCIKKLIDDRLYYEELKLGASKMASVSKQEYWLQVLRKNVS